MAIYRPSRYLEFPIAHLCNFALYLLALACFDFLLRYLVQYHRLAIWEETSQANNDLPNYFWISIGYPLFVWSTLSLIPTTFVSPDLLVAALMYLAAGICIAMRTRRKPVLLPMTLGLVLGLAYLAKAAMFPIAILTMMANCLGERKIRSPARSTAITAAMFVVVAGPWIVALSLVMHRPTFGESGRLNYAWYVNHSSRNRHWQGQHPFSGSPIHPTRRVHESPEVYEFAYPVTGTYPPWTDPTYWNEGMGTRFVAPALADALLQHVKGYYRMFASVDFLFVFLAILCLVQGPRQLFRQTRNLLFLIIPSICVFLMYSLVHTETRFLGAFLTIICLSMAASVRLPAAPPFAPLLRSAAFIFAVILIAKTAFPIVDLLRTQPPPGELNSSPQRGK
jgi:hypothetical protein